MKRGEQKGGTSSPSGTSGMGCKDNVRFTLSDETGVLKFKSFEIANTPACGKLAEELREYLFSRALGDIDIEVIRKKKCPHDVGTCGETIARVIEEHIELFG